MTAAEEQAATIRKALHELRAFIHDFSHLTDVKLRDAALVQVFDSEAALDALLRDLEATREKAAEMERAADGMARAPYGEFSAMVARAEKAEVELEATWGVLIVIFESVDGLRGYQNSLGADLEGTWPASFSAHLDAILNTIHAALARLDRSASVTTEEKPCR